MRTSYFKQESGLPLVELLVTAVTLAFLVGLVTLTMTGVDGEA